MSEAIAIAKDNHVVIGNLLLGVMVRCGAMAVIVTDNGTPWVKMVKYLADISY